MNIRVIVFAGLIGLLISNSLHADTQGHEHKAYVGSKAFESMKQAIGSWEGTIDMGKGPEKVTVSYKLTAAGSVIIETMSEGTPHEMVSVYHDDSSRKLTMTHYCAEHNQPKMTLTAMKNNQLQFDLARDADIDVSHDKHIHAATLRFDEKNKMTQRWASFEGGQEKQVVEITYRRTR